MKNLRNYVLIALFFIIACVSFVFLIAEPTDGGVFDSVFGFFSMKAIAIVLAYADYLLYKFAETLD